MKKLLLLIILIITMTSLLLSYLVFNKSINESLNQSLINYQPEPGTTNETIIGLTINKSIISEQLNGSISYGQPLNTDNSNLISKFVKLTPNLVFIKTNSSVLIDDFFNNKLNVLPCNPIVRRHYYGYQALSIINQSSENVISAYARLNVCDSKTAFTTINLLINGSPRINLCPNGNSLVNGRLFNNCFSDGVISAYMFNKTNLVAVMIYGFNTSPYDYNITERFLNQFFK